MKLNSAAFVTGLFALLAAMLFPGSDGQAAEYPSRPITIVAPFAAGGPLDTIARILSERMRVSLGQAVIIENAVGAGGSIGTGRVVRAAPDGYTISIGNWGTHVANGAIYRLAYDLVNDLEPVALLPSEPFLILSKAALPAKDLKELIAWLKANSGKVSVGTSGVGGPSHIATVFFEQMTGTHFQLVPYRGAGPAVQDLIAGHLDILVTGPSIALSPARAGQIKAYAVAARNRSQATPDIPTVDEAGLPGFYLSVWHGLWLPKGTPKDTVSKLNAAVVDTMADPMVRKRFADLGLEIPPRDQQTPEALGAFHKAEIEKWWPIIKAAGVSAD